MSCMYFTCDVFYIYIWLLFGITCLAYHMAIHFALYQPLYLNSLLIVSTSNELQPHSRRLLAHSMANINEDFWQAIRLFMFQGECMISLNNLLSSLPPLFWLWTNTRQSFLGNYHNSVHLTFDEYRVSSLYFPWPPPPLLRLCLVSLILFLYYVNLICLDVNVLMWSYFVVLGGICPSPLMSCMYCTCGVLYISTASSWYCLSDIPYGNKCCPVPTIIPAFIVNSFFIKRAAAIFAPSACTLHGKHK